MFAGPGAVLEERQTEEGEDRTMKVTHTFKDFTYWNLDARPSVNDKIVQVMHWVDLAKVVRVTGANLDGKFLRVILG